MFATSTAVEGLALALNSLASARYWIDRSREWPVGHFQRRACQATAHDCPKRALFYASGANVGLRLMALGVE